MAMGWGKNRADLEGKIDDRLKTMGKDGKPMKTSSIERMETFQFPAFALTQQLSRTQDILSHSWNLLP